ncbi:MAG: DUF2062 domain-containing protein [Endozoicomonadaceae bacterium]|nr:DUF2062 domain-containing protein [Endozoicomonadaceae bacterium]
MKKFFSRYIPNPDELKKNNSLQFLGQYLFDKQLWYINRKTTAKAIAIGLFSAFIPMPFQMVLSAILAISLRANIPISVALVWITNPLTMPFLFYSTYRFGCFLLNMNLHDAPFHFTIEWLTNTLSFIWLPLYFGSITFAVFISITGYFTTHFLWRRSIQKQWMNRKKK